MARILSIELDEANDAYVVEFWVGQEIGDKPTLNEAFALLGRLDSLQREVYTFVVQWEDADVTMEPDEDLSECLGIFDEYDSPDDLGAVMARQWKTGQMAEALVTQLVQANVFGVWRTQDPEEEQESGSGADSGDFGE